MEPLHRTKSIFADTPNMSFCEVADLRKRIGVALEQLDGGEGVAGAPSHVLYARLEALLIERRASDQLAGD